jgi:hypothetical protein
MTPAGWQFQETSFEMPPKTKLVINQGYFKHVKKATIRINLASLFEQISKFPAGKFHARHGTVKKFFCRVCKLSMDPKKSRALFRARLNRGGISHSSIGVKVV